MIKSLHRLLFSLISGLMFTQFFILDAYADGLAFAWANQPTSSSYTPSSTYALNSKGGINISRSGVGVYNVRLNGINPNGNIYGHVQVTSYGSTNSTCQVRYWSLSSDMNVSVVCFNYLGNAKDEYFTILAFVPSSYSSPVAYVWANNMSLPSYTPSSYYAYNPSGNGITMSRSSVGQYTITYNGLIGKMYQGGHVQVTPYGTTIATCKVNNWYGSGNDLKVNVSCFDQIGRYKDQQFTSAVFWSSYYPVWMSYAWANNPSSASYSPSSYYASPSSTIIEKIATGSYKVKFKGVGQYQSANYPTSVQITPYGMYSANSNCKVRNWAYASPGSSSATMDIYVDCYYLNSTSKVDSYFDVMALYPYIII